MQRVAWLFPLLLALAFAGAAEDWLAKSEAYLKAAPWEALIEGKVRTPTGERTSIKMRVRTLPKAQIVRIEFLAPDSVADNFVVITPEKVMNYLFLTNQVIVYPRKRARIEGLGISLSELGTFDELGRRAGLRWRFLGREGGVVRLVGVPGDPERVGFSRVELELKENPPLPRRYRVLDLGGDPVVDLVWRKFERVSLKKAALLAYPPDAEVIEK